MRWHGGRVSGVDGHVMIKPVTLASQSPTCEASVTIYYCFGTEGQKPFIAKIEAAWLMVSCKERS